MDSICYLRWSSAGAIGTLPGSAAAQRARVVGSVEHVAGAVRSVLRSHRATRGVPSLSARVAERQPAQVDERDARARQRSRELSGLSAFHHRRAVDGSRGVAPPAGQAARSRWGADSRRHQLSQAGPTLGGRGAPVLRHLGQDRELPSRGDGGVVDGRPRLDGRGALVPARDLAHPRVAASRADPGHGALSGEMAPGADARAAGAREWPDGDRRRRRRRVRQQRDTAARPASRAAPVCARRGVGPEGVSWHAGAARARPSLAHGAPAHAAAVAAGDGGRRGPGVGRHPAHTRVAPGLVAQWDPSAVARPLLCHAGDAGLTTGASAGSRPRCGSSANAISARRHAPSTT
jgi:hypothetical protein